MSGTAREGQGDNPATPLPLCNTSNINISGKEQYEILSTQNERHANKLANEFRPGNARSAVLRQAGAGGWRRGQLHRFAFKAWPVGSQGRTDCSVTTGR